MPGMFGTPLDSMFAGMMAGVAANNRRPVASSNSGQVGQQLKWFEDRRNDIAEMAGTGDAQQVYEALRSGAEQLGIENMPDDLNPETFAYRFGLRQPLPGASAAGLPSEQATASGDPYAGDPNVPAELEGFGRSDPDRQEREFGEAVVGSSPAHQRAGFGSEEKFLDLETKRIAHSRLVAEENLGQQGGIPSASNYLDARLGKYKTEGDKRSFTPPSDAYVRQMLSSEPFQDSIRREFSDILTQSGLGPDAVKRQEARLEDYITQVESGVAMNDAKEESDRKYRNTLLKDAKRWAAEALGYAGGLDPGGMSFNFDEEPTKQKSWNFMVEKISEMVSRDGMSLDLIVHEMYESYANKIPELNYDQADRKELVGASKTWTEEHQAAAEYLPTGFKYTELDGVLYATDPDDPSKAWHAPVEWAMQLKKEDEFSKDNTKKLAKMKDQRVNKRQRQLEEIDRRERSKERAAEKEEREPYEFDLGGGIDRAAEGIAEGAVDFVGIMGEGLSVGARSLTSALFGDSSTAERVNMAPLGSDPVPLTGVPGQRDGFYGPTAAWRRQR